MSNDINEIVFSVYKYLFDSLGKQKKRSFLRRCLGRVKEIILTVKNNPRYLKCRYGRDILLGKVSGNVNINNFVPTTRNFPETKIAVYTVITGGYDDFKQHIYVDDSMDYYAVTDAPIDSVIHRLGGGATLR